tara:strand:- start:1091 stop:1402 length:312 start_codon:yes stop_codon:yes gene_type:complete
MSELKTYKNFNISNDDKLNKIITSPTRRFKAWIKIYKLTIDMITGKWEKDKEKKRKEIMAKLIQLEKQIDALPKKKGKNKKSKKLARSLIKKKRKNKTNKKKI